MSGGVPAAIPSTDAVPAPSWQWDPIVDRAAAAMVVLLAVAVPVSLVGGPFVVAGAVGAVVLAALAIAPHEWLHRPAAAGAPAAAVLTFATAAALRGSAIGVVPVVTVALLVTADLVVLDAADSRDNGALRSAVPLLLLGTATAVVTAVTALLQGLPWFWLPVLGGVGALVAYRFVVSGLRHGRTRHPR